MRMAAITIGSLATGGGAGSAIAMIQHHHQHTLVLPCNEVADFSATTPTLPVAPARGRTRAKRSAAQ